MELATLARPYAEASFAAVPQAQRASFADLLDGLATVASVRNLLEFARNPRSRPAEVVELLTTAVKQTVPDSARNLLGLLVANDRLETLPEIARQFRTKLDAEQGMAEAVIESAYALEGAPLAELTAGLEKRFARKLRTRVVLNPELIAGVRVRVGDEVLDASVHARLAQMKNLLTA